jgi:dolichol-phosphate mannosyltransferase
MSSTLVMIPTYNESDNVRVMYTRVRAALPDAEILFVDDNSPDGTGTILDQLAATDALVHVLHREGKLGIGSAHLAGIDWAYNHGTHVLVTMDADCTHSPEEVSLFIAAADNAAVVVGSRFIGQGGVNQWPFHRRLITKGGHFLTQLVLGMRYDATGAYRVYRLDRVPHRLFSLIRSRDYSFFYESLKIVDLARLPIQQVPVVLAPRFEGNSKMRPRDMVRGFTYLFQLGFRSRVPFSSLRRSVNNESLPSN